MSRQLAIEVFKYDELSSEAQQAAREWYAQGMFDDSWWYESAIEHIAQIGAIVGITINTRGKNGYCAYFDCDRNAHFIFDGYYSYNKGWREAVRKEWGPDAFTKDASDNRTLAFLQSFSLEEWSLQAPHFWSVNCSCKANSGIYARQIVDTDVDYNHDVPEEECQELIRSFCEWALQVIQSEIDYMEDENNIADNIRANEYEFDENGSVI